MSKSNLDYKYKGEILILKEKNKKLEEENFKLRKNISEKYKIILKKEKELKEQIKIYEIEDKFKSIECNKGNRDNRDNVMFDNDDNMILNEDHMMLSGKDKDNNMIIGCDKDNNTMLDNNMILSNKKIKYTNETNNDNQYNDNYYKDDNIIQSNITVNNNINKSIDSNNKSIDSNNTTPISTPISNISYISSNKILFNISNLSLFHNINYNEFIIYFTKEEIIENIKNIKNNILEYIILFIDRDDIYKELLRISLHSKINIIEYIQILNKVYINRYNRYDGRYEDGIDGRYSNNNKYGKYYTYGNTYNNTIPYNNNNIPHTISHTTPYTTSYNNTPYNNTYNILLEIKDIITSIKIIDFIKDNYTNEDIIIFIINYISVLKNILDNNIISYIININNGYSKILLRKIDNI